MAASMAEPAAEVLRFALLPADAARGRVLARYGDLALVAVDGAPPQAWATTSAGPPRLAVLDVMMPGLSGLDVLRKVREDERTKSGPVILLTARSRDTDVDSGFATGATDYVIKPFSPRELVHRVSSVLARGA